jgi:chloride channel 7
MAPRDPKEDGFGVGGAADPEPDIEAPLLVSSGSSFLLDPALEDGGGGDEEQRRRRRRFLHGSHTHSNTTSQVALVGADVCPIESLDYE